MGPYTEAEYDHAHDSRRGLFPAALITLADAIIEGSAGWWADSPALLLDPVETSLHELRFAVR